MRHVTKKKRDVRQVPFAGENQEYARVLKMQGNGRVAARFVDGSERTCLIRGSMRKREWIHVGDLVLACQREGLSGDTCDVVYKYQSEEVDYLRRVGQRVDFEETHDDSEAIVFEQDDDDVRWDDV